MADRVSVTSHHSYGSRVGNSFKNIFRGFVLVICSIVLLVWNENNYVKQKAALDEGVSIVQEASAAQIDSSLEGKEVHVYGETASDADALKDDVFGVITDDLKLERTVEMYQWYEDSEEECDDNVGGSEDCTTTYTYDTEWSDRPIDSNNFYSKNGHENPSTWEYESKSWEKSPITLGVYTLTDIFVNKLDNYVTINLSEQDINIPERYKSEQTTTTQTNEPTVEVGETSVEENNNSYLYGDAESTGEEKTIETVSEETTETVELEIIPNEKFHINGDYIYIGKNPSEPAIGDLKITFSSVRPGTVSIVGKQVGNELSSYTVSNGRSISLLEQGNVTAEDMFLHAQQANKEMTWILRFLGLFLMYCGFSMMFKFVETLAKVLPFLANIIGVGRGILALGLTLIVGFVTIGLAWLVVRPIVGVCCLVVAALGIFLLRNSKKSGKGETKGKESEAIENKDNE